VEGKVWGVDGGVVEVGEEGCEREGGGRSKKGWA